MSRRWWFLVGVVVMVSGGMFICAGVLASYWKV